MSITPKPIARRRGYLEIAIDELHAQRADLLSACQALMKAFVGDRNSKNCIGEAGIAADQARAAIARATQERP